MTTLPMTNRDISALVGSRVAGRRVLVAYSGGVDSSVLLHALVEAGEDVCAAHVDHGLRPDSSGDANFCTRIASRLGIDFVAVRIAVDARKSVQGTARRQRYAALVRAASRLHADVIATAHHADDAVESAWLQASRDAGPIGRSGPAAESHWWGFPLTRPLLAVARAEIEVYADSHDVPWREDPTNDTDRYARNRLRRQLSDAPVDVAEARATMPRLRASAASRVRQAARLCDDALAHRAPRMTRLDRAALREGTRDVCGRVMIDLASELRGRLSGRTAADVVDAIFDDDTETRVFCGHDVVVEVSGATVTLEAARGRGTQLIDARATPTVPLPLPRSVRWFELVVDPAARDAASGLCMRGHRVGERIAFEDGTRPIADVLADAGVPPSARWWWPCIFDEERCLRVCGLRTAPDVDEDLLPSVALSGIFDRRGLFAV